MRTTSLALAVTLIFCGTIHSGESESEALAALTPFGAVATNDRSQPGSPIVRLVFPPNTPKKMSDDDLVHLQGLPRLRSLDLGAQPLTDAGLKQIAALTDLQELNLNWNKVTPAGVISLVKSRPGLQRLELSGVSMRDDDVAALKVLTDLRHLGLRRTLITDGGLAHLKAFPKLRQLSLMHTGVTDVGLA